MNQWLQRFPPREQLSLLVLAVFLVVFSVWRLLWVPLASARDEMQQRNVATAESLQRVSTMVAEILRRRESGEAPAQRASLTAVVNRNANALGLAVSRLQPDSRGEVLVRFEAVPLDALLRWLHRMETLEGSLLTELSLSATSVPGRVDASVRAAGGA